MTRVEEKSTRLRHYLAHRKRCVIQASEKCWLKGVLYLRFWDVPVPS